MNGNSTALVAILTIFGVVIGSLLGYLAPSVMLATSFLGSIYLSVLILIALPLVITSIGSGIASLGSRQKLFRTFGKTSAYYGLTGLLAVVLGALTVHFVGPGNAAGLSGGSSEILGNYSQTLPEFFGAFFGITPLASIGIGQYLPLVLLALLFGTAMASIIGRSRILISFIREANNVFSRLIRSWSMFAPIGLASLVGAQIARYSGQMNNISGQLGQYFLTTAIATILFGVIALPLILKFMGRVDGFSFLRNSLQSLLTAFGTGSSAFTFPVTFNAVTKDNEIDERASSIVLPLGTAINFGATAMFTIIAAVFVLQAAGVELGYGQMMMVLLTAILLSLGTAGLPGITGSILMVTLASAGPGIISDPRFVSALTAVLVLDLLLFDRIRATLNIWSDSIGAAVIAQTFEMKTARYTASDSDRPRRPYSHERDQAGRSGRGRPGDRYDRGSRRPDSRPARRSGPDANRSRSRDSQNRTRPRDDRYDRREKATSTSPFEMSATTNVIDHLESATTPELKSASGANNTKKVSAEAPSKTSVTRRSSLKSKDNPTAAKTTRPRRKASDAPAKPRRAVKTEVDTQPLPIAAEDKKSSVLEIPNEPIVRKKERVTEQLSEIPQRDIFSRSEPEKKQEAVSTTPEPVITVPAKEKEIETTQPQADIVSDKITSRKKEEIDHSVKSAATEKPAVPDVATESKQGLDKSESQPASYGRSRPQKSVKPDNDIPVVRKVEEVTTTADPSYNSEDMSFGRARKKRIR